MLVPPDWVFFFTVLTTFCLLIVATVVFIGYIIKRDWRQKTIPIVWYQKSNYSSVERSDPDDNRAIVSINTETSSFAFRHQAQQDEALVKMEQQMAGKNVDALKKKRKKRARKDLTLNQVEHLKDDLQKHLREIRKLTSGKRGADGDFSDDHSDD